MCINFCIFVYRNCNPMRTNIEINDELMKQAMEFSKLKTKKEIVEAALKEFIRKHAVQRLENLRGKVEFFEDYTPRAEG